MNEFDFRRFTPQKKTPIISFGVHRSTARLPRSESGCLVGMPPQAITRVIQTPG